MGFDRRRWEAGFGQDLSRVVVHDDQHSAALAASHDAHAVAREGELFLGRAHVAGELAEDMVTAHELAHALGARDERAADQAGATARARMRGWPGPAPQVRGQGSGGAGLRSCARGPSAAQKALDGKLAFTPALARDALIEYRALSGADRQSAVDKYYPSGGLQRLLAALPPADASGPFNDVVQDVLQRVQRSATLTSAAGSGMANENAMVVAQSAHMQAENLALAQATTGVAAPTPVQVQAEQRNQVAATSVPPSVPVMTPAQEAAYTTAATTAVAAFVAWATANNPGLGLAVADFSVQVRAVEARGLNVIAKGGTVGGRRVAVVGRTFTRYVQADPAYALSVVMHELHGHPEYGPYGTPGSEYGLTLYDKAAAMAPGYVQPVGTDRTSEMDAYGYQETEIYSLLRSLPFHKPLAPAHAALQPYYLEPEPNVVRRLQLMRDQWAAGVAKALVRGMYERFRLDPRLTPAAMSAFRRSVNTVFAADAKDILK
ncbi:DUF4157 domain-containing protein [Actinoplanes sp. M2I2]|uniref:eCIS core domain-containing protein n=1 Tax=Actinoplanes sp. M2I2 TaxID=1734444 RepID=UPI00202254D4|nr:DUF4157 domain-containing protein [Actinoplanes sp. M2I2]